MRRRAAATATRSPRARSLPPIPAAVHSIAGPIPVVRVPELRDPESGERCSGVYSFDARTISLDAGLALPSAWLTLWHERTHAIFADAGVLFPEGGGSYENSLEEQVCNALALALVSDMTRT